MSAAQATGEGAMPGGGATPGGGFVPYPGLRSFQHDETAVFFGRDGAVHDMLGRLGASRFLAVLGASGSGKSSLVRTGMLEGLEMGLIAKAGSLWRIVDIPHPGADPMLALARALSDPGAGAHEVEQMRAYLLGGPRSLVEWAGSGRLAPGQNMLLLIDQFEEIFRYRNYEGHQETEAFIALILESARSREVPIYVTLTMRSEYLGACALFGGLAEAMNRGQYLTPRLGREECRAAIEGPAAVCRFQIEPALVTKLLNDLASFAPWSEAEEGDFRSQLDLIGRRADQLPLLQHVLNRLWLRAIGRQAGAGVTLTRDDYEALGGLRGAIDQHASEIAATLAPETRAALPDVFRALTTGPSVADAVRRPTRLSALAEICGTDLATVQAIVEAFRGAGCNFLTPPPPVALLPETDIDISHESLIRQWTDLSAWLEAETRDADSLRRLDEAAQREAAGTGELLEGRALTALVAWQKESPHPPAWAARYVRDPVLALAFLDRSVRAAAKGRRTRTLWRGAMAGGAVALAVLAVVWLSERSLRHYEAEQAQIYKDVAAKGEARNEELAVESDLLEQERDALTAHLAVFTAEVSQKTDELFGLAQGTIARNLNLGEIAAAADLLSSTALLSAASISPLASQMTMTVLALHAGGRPSAEAEQLHDEALASDYYVVDPISNLAPLSPFVIRAITPDEASQNYVVVDTRNGSILHHIALPDSIGVGVADYAVAESGDTVLIRDLDGRLLRWEAGQTTPRRVPDPSWKNQFDVSYEYTRYYSSAVFDEERDEIGVVFEQFGELHYLLLPKTGAAKARTFRTAEVFQRLALATPALIDGQGQDFTAWTLVLVGIRDGGFLFSLSGPDLTRVVLVDMAEGGEVRQIGPDFALYAEVHPTQDRDRLTIVTSHAVGQVCDLRASGPLSADTWFDGSSYCLGNLDLATGDFTPDPQAHPVLSTYGGFLDIGPKAPIDTQSPIIVGGTGMAMPDPGVPPLALSPPVPGGGMDGMPFIESWRLAISSDGTTPFSSLDFDESGTSGVELRQFDDGLTVLSQDPWNRSRIVTRDGDILTDKGNPEAGTAAASGAILSAEIWPDPGNLIYDEQVTGRLTHAHDDRFALLTGEDRLLYLLRRDAADPVEKVWVAADASCGGKLPGGLAKEGAPVAEATWTIRPLQLAIAGQDWFVVELAKADGATERKRLGLMRLRDAAGRSGGPTARVYCPGSIAMSRVLSVDLAPGRSAMIGETGRNIEIWSIAPDRAEISSRVVELPAGKSAVALAFLGDGAPVIADAEGALYLDGPAATADGPSQTRLLSGPLPGLSRILAAGNRILLARQSGTPFGVDGITHETLFLALAEVDAKAGTMTLTHGAGLPLAAWDVMALRPQQTGAVVEALLFSGVLLRINLPMLPPAEGLAKDLQTLSSPEPAQDGNDADSAILRLLVSSIAEEPALPPLAGSVSCGALVEAAIGSLLFATKPPAEARACSDPAALALRAALLSRTGDAQAPVFGPTTNDLLDRAAGGDSLALAGFLALLGQEEMGANPRLTVGASRLAAWLREPNLSGTAYADPASGDAEAHLRLAEVALAKGDAAAAFKHAWIAEATFSSADVGHPAETARELRYTSGTLLSPTERLEILRELEGWAPVFPSAPPARPTNLETDLAALDRIAAQSGATAEIALLKLGRIEEELKAEGADRTALILRGAEILVATRDWPKGAVDEARLQDSFEQFRAALPPEAATLALKLDAAFVSAVESDGPILTFQAGTLDPAGRGTITAYVAAADRLLAAPEGDRAEIGAVLRFRSEALDYDVSADSTDNPPLTTDALIARRGDLAAAYPMAEGAEITAAAAVLWQLKEVESLFDPASSEKLRDAFDGLLSQAAQGKLVRAEDLGLVAAAARWMSDDLASIGVAPGTPAFATLAAALDRLSFLQENDGTHVRYGPPDGTRVRVLAEVLFDLQENLPRLVTAENRDQAQSMALDLIVESADLMRLWQMGASNGADQEDYFGPGDWPTAPAYVVAWVAASTADLGESTKCDQLASFPKDPIRRAAGVPYDELKTKARGAVDACKDALAKARAGPDPARVAALAFLLGRAKEAVSDAENAEFATSGALTCYLAAAKGGHAAALNNLSAEFGNAYVPYRQAYQDLVLRDHFLATYWALLPLADTAEDRAALIYFARLAADLGSGEANAILSQFDPDPVEREVRRQIAEKIRAEQGEVGFTPASLAYLDSAALAGPDFAAVVNDNYILNRVAGWVAVPPTDLAETLDAEFPDEVGRTCE